EFEEDDEAFEAPPPATWAGRRGQPADEEAGELGLTEEFDRVGEQFSAEWEEDEVVAEKEEEYDFHGAEGAPGDPGDDDVDWEDFKADEREVPPDEFEFIEDELEEEGELEVEEEFATGEHEVEPPAEPEAPADPPVGATEGPGASAPPAA